MCHSHADTDSKEDNLRTSDRKMESQKPCRKVESKTSDRKMEPNKKKRRNKNIDPKKNKKEKNKDSHSKKEKSTGDKLFLKKVGERPEESYEDTESVTNCRSENFSDTRTHVISDQFVPTCESNSEGVQGNSDTNGDIMLPSISSSISASGNDQENILARIDQHLIGSRDEMQELTIQTEPQALAKAELLTGLRNLRNKLQEFPVTRQTEQQAEYPTALGNLSGMDKLQELPVIPQTEQQILKKAEYLTALGDLRLYTVVKNKVHWPEKAFPSEIALKDSNVVVSLIKSSNLAEIILDVSFVSDSRVHKSQPVTVQAFQEIMQRMGLPANPQLYEPLEHSNPTNDIEELSYVVLFAEEGRRYYFIPVQRGSLLQRKDAREREESVNPWGILLTVNNLTPEQHHLLNQSLRMKLDSGPLFGPTDRR